MLPVGMEKLQKSLAFRSSFSAYLLQIQTLPTYQKCWTGQETTWEQVFLQDFWHFYIRFQMETPIRTASILVFLAHSVPILSGNLNWEGKEKKKKKKPPTICPSISEPEERFLIWAAFNIRKQETMFSGLSSVVHVVHKHGCCPRRRFGLHPSLYFPPVYAQRSMSDNKNK